MSKEFTHIDHEGNAFMVDVSEKDITERIATAEGSITLCKEAYDLVMAGKAKKGQYQRTLFSSEASSGQSKRLLPIAHTAPSTGSGPVPQQNPCFQNKPLPSFAPLCRVFRYPLCGIRSEASSGNPFAKPRNAPILNFKFNFEFKQSCHYRVEPDSDTFCVKSVYQKILFLALE